MKAIVNGRILLDGKFIEGMALLFDQRIAGFQTQPPEGAQLVDAGGGYVSPGLIDVHCHGFGGREAGDAGVDAPELARMSRELATHGVTAWLPTVSCVAWERYPEILASIDRARQMTSQPGFAGARVLGAHLEGPFLSPKRHGAQNAAHLLAPDSAPALPFSDVLRVVTVAPETKGALARIQALASAGVVVSLGHTDATYEQAVSGFNAGARHATHLWNAMPPLLSRAPGILGAALMDDRVYCELIADGFHVHPSLLLMTARLKGDRLVLVSDSIRFAGFPEGTHTLGGQTVTLGGLECRLSNGVIAGSLLSLDRAVSTAWAAGGLPLATALAAATQNAAASIREPLRGSLKHGYEADIAVFDARMRPTRVFTGGQEVALPQ